jgi:hypothetical protein
LGCRQAQCGPDHDEEWKGLVPGHREKHPGHSREVVEHFEGARAAPLPRGPSPADQCRPTRPGEHRDAPPDPAGRLPRCGRQRDGVGFDPATISARSGIGLVSIRQMLEYLGGKLEIASAPGQGSRFTLTVPLTQTLS